MDFERIMWSLCALGLVVVGALGWHDCSLDHETKMACHAGPVANDADGCVRGHVELVGAQLVCQCPGGR